MLKIMSSRMRIVVVLLVGVGCIDASLSLVECVGTCVVRNLINCISTAYIHQFHRILSIPDVEAKE